MNLVSAPGGVTYNGLLQCTLLCVGVNVFSQVECMSETGGKTDCGSDVFSLAKCVVKATSLHLTVCLEGDIKTNLPVSRGALGNKVLVCCSSRFQSPGRLYFS